MLGFAWNMFRASEFTESTSGCYAPASLQRFGICLCALQCLIDLGCCLQDSVAVLKKFMANANTIKFNLIALAKADQQ